MLRFAEQSNAIDYLSSIQRSRGMELDAPVFTTPLGNAYRVGDGFSSTAAEQRDTLMVVERVDEDNVWYTLPSVPEQETVSVDRTVLSVTSTPAISSLRSRRNLSRRSLPKTNRKT